MLVAKFSCYNNICYVFPLHKGSRPKSVRQTEAYDRELVPSFGCHSWFRGIRYYMFLLQNCTLKCTQYIIILQRLVRYPWADRPQQIVRNKTLVWSVYAILGVGSTSLQMKYLPRLGKHRKWTSIFNYCTPNWWISPRRLFNKYKGTTAVETTENNSDQITKLSSAKVTHLANPAKESIKLYRHLKRKLTDI